MPLPRYARPLPWLACFFSSVSLAQAPSAGELEKTLSSAIKPWGALKAQLKSLSGDEVAQEEGTLLLRGQVRAYDVPGSTFTAVFSNADTLERLEVTLNPAAGRSLSGKLNKSVVSGHKLDDLVPTAVDVSSLRVNALEVDFSGGQIPKAVLVASISAPWHPVSGLGLRSDAAALSFVIDNPTAKKKAQIGVNLAAPVHVGPAAAVLTGGSSSPKSDKDWTLTAEFGSVSVGDVIQGVPGEDADGLDVAAALLSLKLDELTLSVNPKTKAIGGSAVSAVGSVAFLAQKTGAGPTRQTDFLLGLAPPSDFELASLVPELAPADELGLGNGAIVLASRRKAADLPIFDANLQRQVVPRGLTLLGVYDLQAQAPDLSQLLQVRTVVLQATLGVAAKSAGEKQGSGSQGESGGSGGASSDAKKEKKAVTLQLIGAVETPGDGVPLVPNSDVIRLKKVQLRLKLGANATEMELGAVVDVQADQQTLSFKSDIGIDFVGPTLFIQGELIAVDGQETALWSNPFGISEGLHLGNLGLRVGANFKAAIPLPVLAFEGELVAGDPARPEFRGFATVGIDPASPQKSVIDAGFSELSLPQIVRAFTPAPTWGAIPANVRGTVEGIRLSDVRLSVCPSPTGVDLFGVHYNRGFLVQGRTDIADWQGELYVAVNERGIEARGRADAIRAEPFFALTGARGAADPSVNIVLGPRSDVKVAFSGEVSALGFSREADVLVYPDGFDVFTGGKLFGSAFGADVELAGGSLKQGGDLYAVAQMSSDLTQFFGKHASEEINRASQDAQDQIRSAQASLAQAKADLEHLNRTIASYTQELEAERDQRCLDIKNTNEDVRRSTTDVETARRLVADVDNDPGVVRARQDMERTQRDLAQARADVQNWGSDPAVSNARAALATAQAEVNRLQADIDRLEAEIDAMEATVAADALRAVDLGPQLALKRTEATALYASMHTARGALTLAQGAVDESVRAAQAAANEALRAAEGAHQGYVDTYNAVISEVRAAANQALGAATGALERITSEVEASYTTCKLQSVEGDPRLLALKESKIGAQSSLDVAIGFLEGVRAATSGTLIAADWIVRNGDPAGVFEMKSARFEGCLATVTGGRVTLAFDGSFAGDALSGSIAFAFGSPMTATEELATFLLDNNRAPTANPARGSCSKPSFMGRQNPSQGLALDQVKDVPDQPTDLQGERPKIPPINPPDTLGVLPK